MEKKDYKSSIINKNYTHFKNNCFLNSSLQTITKPIYFYKYLIDNHLIIKPKKQKKSLNELINLITKGKKKSYDKNAHEQSIFLETWEKDWNEQLITTNRGFCSVLTSKFIENFPKFRDLFQTKRKRVYECPICFKSITVENTYGLDVPETQNSIKNFIFGKKSTTFKAMFDEIIEFYFENFKRCPNPNCRTISKIDDIQLPKFLYMIVDGFLDQFDDVIFILGANYSICDVVFSIDNVHFVSFSKRKNDEWWYFNDMKLDIQKMDIQKMEIKGNIIDNFKKFLGQKISVNSVMYEKD
jgi:hypothetical protein